MSTAPITAAAIGSTDTAHWGQVFYCPEAFGVVEIVRDGGNAQERGLTILSELSQLFSQGGAQSNVGSILQRITEPAKSVVLLSIEGHTVHVGLRGQGAVYLKRGQKIAAILSKSGVLSGEVQPGDCLILVTQSVDSAVTHPVMLRLLDDKPVFVVAEAMTRLLHEIPEGMGGAALLVEINQIAQHVPPTPKKQTFRIPRIGIVSSAQKYIQGVSTRLARVLRAYRKVFLTILISGFFITSVSIGIYRQVTDQYAMRVNATLAEADRVTQEGLALKELNIVKSRERIAQAMTLVEPLMKTTSSRSALGKKVLATYAQIQEELRGAMNISEHEPELFFDATLVKERAQITSFGMSDSSMVLIDKQTNALYTLIPETKTAEVIGGGAGFEKMVSAVVHGESIAVLTDTGITTISISDKKATRDKIKKTDEWGRVDFLVSFGGNVYMLDMQKNRIWKYVATETGFTELREYLNPDAFPDLSDATSMAIDGTVWIGNKRGMILHFVQGREETFTPRGVDPPFGRTLSVYTDDASKQVYVLDTDNKRVVVLDKDGLYSGQYKWKSDLKVSQIAVSEAHSKLFLLASGRLYSLSMK